MERLHPGVYIQEVSSGVRPIEGVSTSTTAFVGKTQKGRVDTPELVTSFTEFQTTYGGFLSDSYVVHAALHYFANGGKRLYVARATSSATPPAVASLTILDRQGTPADALTIAAINPGSWANGITVAISAASVDAANQFRLTISRGGEQLESFDNLSANASRANLIENVVNGRSRYVTAKMLNNGGTAALRPAIGSYELGSSGTPPGVSAATPGTDGATPSPADLIAALAKLDAIADVNLVAVPGIGTPAIVDAGTGYCAQRQDCFFIGETAAADDDEAKAAAFVNALTVKSSFGAVYFPWLKATDPTGRSAAPIAVPPSGYVAGIYARTDAKRGVWKAPAGTEANLTGTVGLVAQINDAQQDLLNPIGANVIRAFPSSGVVVWGARTLATAADPEYRYVSVRRLALFLERSIYEGIQWAVFEPNDDDLWASLRLNVGAFMMNMFRAGAFQGGTPSQAFFVKCDEENNPQSEIDAGVVNVLIGFAPVKPAEFVVIKISQKAGDAAL